MGFKATEVSPISSIGPTATTPVGKDVLTKVFAVNRTDTTASVKCVLPGDATIVDLRVFVPAVSNAGTAANVSVGILGGSNTYFLTTVDVKGAAGMLRPTTQVANILNLENIPLTGDINMTAIYAESGATSSAGGPFYVIVEYVR